MSKTYHICQKLNYATESEEKRRRVDMVTKLIHEKMNAAGYEEVNETSRDCDVVFAIGGDGTMLHSMHHNLSKGSMIIGVNAGNVGFLTPYSIDDVLSGHVFEFLTHEARIEKRSVLYHSFGHKKGIAVNEYVVKTSCLNSMIEFSVEVEHRGHISRAGTYRADGLIVSGPCGSTAYNMNVGGAIVDPSVRCMQMTLIAPTLLGQRPLIVGKNSKIHIRVQTPAKIFSDGMLYHDMNPNEDLLSISLHARESKVMVPDDWNFYSVLSKKLHWNNGREV